MLKSDTNPTKQHHQPISEQPYNWDRYQRVNSRIKPMICYSGFEILIK